MASRSPGPTIEDGLLAIRRRWPELFDRDEGDEEGPVFILSAGWRSGSTMLHRLLTGRCLIWGEPYGHAWPIPSMADQVRCFTDRWPETHHFYRGQPREELATRFIANLYPGVGDLLQAHRDFFDRLFARPARASGHDRWGLKEVRLDADHALYLRWLFPRARFLFLIRNPYDAWRSYAARAARGWQWYNRWPDQPLTAQSFAAHWERLASSFLEGFRKVDGLLIRYEDLAAGRTKPVEDHLGFELSTAAARANPGDGGPAPLASIPEEDALAIEEELGRLAGSLGYHLEPSRRETTAAAGRVKARKEPDRCVVIVPFRRFIEPACEAGLREVERRGYVVRRVPDDEGIDLVRGRAVEKALREGFDEILWIDSDLEFDPDAVDQLRALDRPLVAALDTRFRPVGRAEDAPDWLIERDDAGAGFLLTWREVYLMIREREGLLPCIAPGGGTFVPYFLPMIVWEGGESRYLSDNHAFTVRARRAGFRVVADPRIRVRPIASRATGWDDLSAGSLS